MKVLYALMALAMIGIVTVSGVSAFGGNMGMVDNEDMQSALENSDYDAFIAAAQEGFADRITQERFDEMADKFNSMEAVHEAINNRDYKSWLEAQQKIEQPRLSELITAENFDTYVDMHNARISGDFEVAQELSEELGLDGYMMQHKGGHGRFGAMKGTCMGG